MLVLMLHKVFCNVERLIKLNLVYTGVAICFDHNIFLLQMN